MFFLHLEGKLVSISELSKFSVKQLANNYIKICPLDIEPLEMIEPLDQFNDNLTEIGLMEAGRDCLQDIKEMGIENDQYQHENQETDLNLELL
jgi:hypothetical protein